VKSLALFLLGLVLGALLHRAYDRSQPDAPAPVRACVAQPVDSTCVRSAPAGPSGNPAPPAPAAAASPEPLVNAASPDRADPTTDPGLLIPVQGKTAADLTDTFADSRMEGRPHEAIDIMAAAGTPVLAVSDGHVEKLFVSEKGGLTIYQFEPTGRYAYYYAHLQRYADGLREQQTIRKGEVIGYVGATGNADPAAPHLHFAIFLLGPERQWWKGTAINPYPLLHRN
jgi:murein DD-endopeptidase MepM/ murein hydrolase activator NlpD